MMGMTPEESKKFFRHAPPHIYGENEKPKVKSRGLGDTIAKITSAVGITPCSKCKKRQAMLNRVLPYKT